MSLATVLKGRGIAFDRKKDGIQLDNGLIARPQFVELQPRDDGLVRTVTTIEMNHPVLCPTGTFEYQHSIGSTVEDSLQKGFAGWTQTDLPVFAEALRDKFESCMLMQSNPSRDSPILAEGRQVILGPPSHAVVRAVADAGEDHDFCPCCLFTNCIDAFHEQLAANTFHGVRLFATRDADGLPQADCRVNGVDWPAGAAALLKYVATWADRGFEFRKQFVAIRTFPAADGGIEPR
jgi:hypothetical protein